MSWSNHKCFVHRRWEKQTAETGRRAGNTLTVTEDSTSRAKLEPVVADTDGKVDTNAGNVHVPEEAAIKPATTAAEVEQTLDKTTEGVLNTGAALSQITAMMVGRELLDTWAIADAMSLENDDDVPAEATETTTLAVEEEGEEVHVDRITPADKLL